MDDFFGFQILIFFSEFSFSREDVNKQLDTIQGDLDSLKELFQADTDYSLDANALFGVSERNVFFSLLGGRRLVIFLTNLIVLHNILTTLFVLPSRKVRIIQ